MRRGDNSVTPIEALYDRARIDPNGTAFMVGHDRWEYGDVAAQVQRLARGMSARGLRKGDRVVLHMQHLNTPYMAISIL